MQYDPWNSLMLSLKDACPFVTGACVLSWIVDSNLQYSHERTVQLLSRHYTGMSIDPPDNFYNHFCKINDNSDGNFHENSFLLL